MKIKTMTTTEKLSKYYEREVTDVDEKEKFTHFKIKLDKWNDFGITWKKGYIYNVANFDGVAHILLSIDNEDLKGIV